MTVPALLTSTISPLAIEGDVLVIGVLKTSEGPRLARDDEVFNELQLALDSIGVTGEVDELR
ncbi:MAG: leucyl aminopeptidase, partial [Salinibacterium sp.]|nr:leucyl aminopeptidase [Salinibacterium sp.]